MKPTLLILSAGMGSRYGGLKQIDAVGDHQEAIIDYSIYDAIRSGFGKVVFVIRREIENEFKQFVGKKFANQIETNYAFQELSMLPKGYICPSHRVKPWGTAHAIWCARGFIKEPFAVINGDDFYGASGYRLMSEYLSLVDRRSTSFAMVGYTLNNTLSEYGSVSRGICEIEKPETNKEPLAQEKHFLKKVVERTNIEKREKGIEAKIENGKILSLSGNEIVSLNLFGFSPALFPYLEKKFCHFLEKNINVEKSEYFIPAVIDEMLQQKEATVELLKSNDKWFGITYKEDKKKVKESIKALIEEGQYPRRLW